MRVRSLIILLLLLGVAAGVAALVVHRQASERTGAVLGANLLADFPVNEIASLTIRSPDGTVSLVKQETRWVVKERFDYPADFGRITDLVRTLKEAKVGSRFEGSAEALGRLALNDPEDPQAAAGQKGTRILLRDDKEKVLASVLLGRARQADPGVRTGGGRYVRLGESPMVYLISEQLLREREVPAAWLAREPLRVVPGEVKRISCLTADGRRTIYAFQRPERQQELVGVGLPASQKVKQYELRRVAAALGSLYLEDVVDPGTTDVSMENFPFRLEYELSDGTIYRVYPGKECPESGGCLLRLEVDYRSPAAQQEKAGDTAAASEMKKDPAVEARELNQRLSPWVYRVSRPMHSTLVTDRNKFLEKDEQKKAGKGRPS